MGANINGRPSSSTNRRSPFGALTHRSEVIGLGSPVFTSHLIAQDSTPIAVTGTGNTALPPPPGLVPVSGPFDGYVPVTTLVNLISRGITPGPGPGEVTILEPGIYTITNAWATFQHSAFFSTVGFILGIFDGVNYRFNQNPTTALISISGGVGNLGGGGTFTAFPGEIFSVWTASDNTGTITISNGSFTTQKIDDI